MASSYSVICLHIVSNYALGKFGVRIAPRVPVLPAVLGNKGTKDINYRNNIGNKGT